MWCTRWFLPLLLLPFPIAPPYFLVLFLLTLALHAKPCFYCIILLAALFLSSCYWQSFPLEAHLSIPWADNITTFSQALNASMPPHLHMLDSAPLTVRVVDRCWCDFASGLFEPYDVQQWERDSIQQAVVQMEKQWKQSHEPDTGASANATVTSGPSHIDSPQASPTPTVSDIRNETLTSIFRSLFSRRLNKPEPPPKPTPIDTTTPPPIPTESSLVRPSLSAAPLLAPGQLDMRPFGFELILDFRWPRRS